MATLEECLAHLNAGRPIGIDDEYRDAMMVASTEARELCVRLNQTVKSADIRKLLSEITGTTIPDNTEVLTPFTTDFGKNLHLGPGVFINAGCHFQDQGGITIEEGALVGHNVVIATLNHGLHPSERQILLPAPVRIGKGAWIGSNATILPSVTIGEHAVIGAGSVVTRDIPAYAVAVGSPARVVRTIDPDGAGA